MILHKAALQLVEYLLIEIVLDYQMIIIELLLLMEGWVLEKKLNYLDFYLKVQHQVWREEIMQ